MDLYSGLPYWITKNPLYNYFNPLQDNIKTDILIIGSGITGSLVANELCKAGIKCTVIDKRNITTGSSTASTALLQYEIDVPLCEMVKKIKKDLAVKAYRCCLQSITDIQRVFEETGYNPDFKKVPSVYYASNRKGHSLIKREYEYRKKYNLPCELLDKKQLYQQYHIKAPGALVNKVSAQMDPYAGGTHLLNHQMQEKNLTIYTHTEVDRCIENPGGYDIITTNGHTISCYAVVIAAGFEAGKFLPEKVMKLTSTYAIISQPVEEKYLWPEYSLIWETKEPYLYIRTDGKNRIIVGGEDENFRNPILRDRLLRKKVTTLEKKIKKLFPDIPFVTDMAWCGTFSSTDDGLPYIGNWPGKERMFYALGYGGNGITFSMIAAQLIRNKINRIKDDREEVFGFGRIKSES